MKKFKVSGLNIEHLMNQEISANNAIEAEEKFLKFWDDGMICVGDTDLEIEVKEI